MLSTESYVSLEKKDVEILTEEEKKQINFAKKIKTEHMLVCENDKSIETIISEISHSPDLNKLQGWIRDISNEEWKSTHKIFDLHGRWFHVLYNIDIDYIRYGYIDIEQNFNELVESVNGNNSIKVRTLNEVQHIEDTQYKWMHDERFAEGKYKQEVKK